MHTTTSPVATASDPETEPTAPATVRLIALSHLAVDLAAGAFLATLPATLERLDASGAALGLVVALYSVAALGLQPLLGRIADVVGLRRTSVVCAVAASVALTAAGASSRLGLLVVGVVVGGLASGAFHPAGAALARSAAPASPERAVAAFAAAGTIGLALGPVAGIALVGSTGAPLAMPVLALPAVVVALVLLRRDHGHLPASHSERVPVRRILQPLGRIATLAALVSIAATAVASTVPLLIARRPGGTSTDLSIGVALATFSLAMALGGMVAGVVVRRTDPALVVRSGLVVAAAAGVLTLLCEPGGAAFTVALGATGFALGPAIPILLVAAQDRLPGSQAAASGVVLGLANGVAGVVFMAIAATHGTLGLELGAVLALVGLVPAAALTGTGVAGSSIARRAIERCRVTACGCAVGLETAPS
jgi:FSR family fosmidomycin resistance protein-like MFS transporter